MRYKVQCKYVVTKDYEGNIIDEGEKKYYIVKHLYTTHNGNQICNKVKIGKSCPAFNTKEEALEVLKNITHKQIVEEFYTL
jgi:hypothetical protein